MTIVKGAVYFVLAVMLMAAAVYWRGQGGQPAPSEIVAGIEQNLNNEISTFINESNAIESATRSNKPWPELRNAFFLSDSSGVIQWNTTQYFPELQNLTFDSITYFKSGTSHYLVLRKAFNQYFLTGYLTLQRGFSIQNQYLSTELNHDIVPYSGVTLDVGGEVFPIQYKGENFFPISINTQALVNKPTPASWVLLAAGLALIFLALRIFIIQLLEINKRVPAIGLITIAIVSIRMVMVYGHFPGVSTGWAIFDPRIFASSTFNDSIGNLLLNTIALCTIAFFTFWLYRDQQLLYWRRRSLLAKATGTCVLLILCFAAQVLSFLYLETIYHNSSLILDFSQQLYFDSARLSALFCTILSSVTGLVFLFIFLRLAIRITRTNFNLFLICLATALTAFFLYHFLTRRHYEVPIALTVVNLLVLTFSSVSRRWKFVLTGSFSIVFFELIILGAQTTLAIQWLSVEREREAMVKFGNTFLIERDVLGEYLLSQAITKIETDAFIQQQIVNPFNRLSAIEQKIRHNHLSAYLNRYETQIYLFDNRGQAVGADHVKDLPVLIQDFTPLAENTNYKGIYLIRNPGNQLLKRYLAVIPIKFHVSGFIVLDMTLRQVLPVSVFPKLLLDNRFDDYANQRKYSFAIFSKGAITNSAGEFNYQQSELAHELTNPRLYHNELMLDEYRHIGIEDIGGQVVIISSPLYSLFSIVSNFSFYFLAGLSTVLIGLGVVNIPSIRRRTLSYSNQIQLYVYLAMVLPLMALAITILRINSVSEEQHLEEHYEEKARNMSASLAQFLSSPNENLQAEIIERAQGAGADVTLFSTSGLLMASSQPDIFSNQLVSRLIAPQTLKEISEGNQLFTRNEEIGNLKFRTTYAVVKSPSSDRIMGIVSMPFFESQELKEKDEIRLVSNILGVFVFVLLLFYPLSFIALNWLTSPLRAMAASLQRTTLSGGNRKLAWNSKDEIGSMVKEYNRMIDNLAKSREELEKRQRETTWREMARQVAHEIKNPLTPIKLTLQHLERSFIEGRGDQEKTIQSVKTVLHQVDILNEIASSFSAFAQMPELKLERLNVVEIVNEVVDLHNNPAKNKIQVEASSAPVWVMADRKLFSRIFSNIILNAFQASKETEEVIVKVKIEIKSNVCLLSFSDNGLGMLQEVLDKIFIPYFSTKETGSGLGLAIAKQGIEQAGGKIWCESAPGIGSAFYISLPLTT